MRIEEKIYLYWMLRLLDYFWNKKIEQNILLFSVLKLNTKWPIYIQVRFLI